MTTFYNTETTVKLAPLTCSQCGVPYALAERYMQARRDDHKNFYCPNGHSQHYPHRSALEQAEAELAAARRIARNERDRREQAERQRAAARGQVTRIKRRVGRGVCPCCNRTFANLANHMAGQHPEFSESA